MSYKNRITIIGNVSQPPKVNFTGDGTPVCNFSIATNHFWKNQNGEKQTESTYFQCSAWDKLVPRVETLQVGQKIEIEGRVKNNSWDKNCSCGQVHKNYRSEVQVQNILYLTPKDENQNN